MQPIPLQPENAYPPEESLERAKQVVASAIFKRVGCDIGEKVTRLQCHAFIGNDPLPQSLSRELWSYMDKVLAGCALNRASENQSKCLIGLVTSLGIRYNKDVNTYASILSSPYERWQQDVRKIQDKPVNVFASCQNMLTLVDNKSNSLSMARKNVDQKSLASSFINSKTNERASTPLSGDSMRCFHDLNRYINNRRGLRYVALPGSREF